MLEEIVLAIHANVQVSRHFSPSQYMTPDPSGPVRIKPSWVFICSFTTSAASEIRSDCSLTLFPEVTTNLRNSNSCRKRVLRLGENIWDVQMFCCPSIMLFVLDAEGKVVLVIDEAYEACIWEAWEEDSADFILVVATTTLRSVRFLASRSSGVMVVSLHISLVSTKLTGSRGISVAASELNRSSNLLFVVLRIDPSTDFAEWGALVSHSPGGRRVMGIIWCVCAGEQNSLPLRSANWVSP